MLSAQSKRSWTKGSGKSSGDGPTFVQTLESPGSKGTSPCPTGPIEWRLRPSTCPLLDPAPRWRAAAPLGTLTALAARGTSASCRLPAWRRPSPAATPLLRGWTSPWHLDKRELRWRGSHCRDLSAASSDQVHGWRGFRLSLGKHPETGAELGTVLMLSATALLLVTCRSLEPCLFIGNFPPLAQHRG